VVAVAIANAYRSINLLRVAHGQTKADYLARVARNTSLWLISLQAVILGLSFLKEHYHIHIPHGWELVAVIQLVAALLLYLSTSRNLRKNRPPVVTSHYSDKDLPSLTVAIPARNETRELEECLRLLTASNYPKLEILVLDDCSQNRRTPEIIKQFAHDGVRFIAGDVPPDNWLAKNFAYEQLAKQANGELLLFCGIDAQFQPNSLRVLVELMLEKKKSMVSIVPDNTAPSLSNFEAHMVQPSRYAWELVLPRRLLNRPPVLSTCWLISAAALHKAGGFKAVNHSISPESYFARFTALHDDGYSFMQSNQEIGLHSAKSYLSQRATAIRTRYPQLHRRPELVAALTVTELFLLYAPFVTVVIGLIGNYWTLVGLSAASSLLLSAMYSRVLNLTYRRHLIRGWWLLPFATLYDVALLNYSMYQYEFKEVIWKGRNVCIPVMHVIQRLPKLPS
jgi:glycosyltransferase involved in cell wall biosynthesis